MQTRDHVKVAAEAIKLANAYLTAKSEADKRAAYLKIKNARPSVRAQATEIVNASL